MRKLAPWLSALLVVAALAVGGSHVKADPPAIPVPPENARELRQRPPVPPVGDAEARARVLFDAIVHDDPARAEEFFFPRDPFLILKAIRDPGRYWERLVGWYRRDIHNLHRQTPRLAEATFDGFVLSPMRTWMTVGREGNNLPYWSVYHSYIQYRVAERRRRLEVRVLINWGQRWFVTHLV